MQILPEDHTIVQAVNSDGEFCGCFFVDSERRGKERERDEELCLCPVHHEDVECEAGVSDMVGALRKVHGGRIVHQCPVWSERKQAKKRQGRTNGRFAAGRDHKVDLVVERWKGALFSSNTDDVMGIEVDGAGHASKKAKKADGKKKKTALFGIHTVKVALMHDDDDWLAEAQKVVSSWQV